MEISSKELFGDNVNDFKMYSFQASAVQWARCIEYFIKNPNNFKGGVFGDTMGLGKTFQACALVAANPVKTTLICCPRSVKYAWIDTCLKCCKYLNIYTIENGDFYKCTRKFGSDGTFGIETKKVRGQNGEIILEPYVVIVNFHLVSLGTKNDSMITDKIWSRIIIDEAHCLKNSNIDTWDKLSSLKQPTIETNGIIHRYGTRWCLTGTPIHGDNSDLINIFRFIDSRFLDSKFTKEKEEQLRILISTNLFRRNSSQLTSSIKKHIKYPETEPSIYDIKIGLTKTDFSEYVRNLSYADLRSNCQNTKFVNNLLNDELAFLIAKTTDMKYKNSEIGYGKFEENTQFRNMISYPFLVLPECIPNYESLKYTGRNSKLETFKNIINSKPRESFVVFYHFKPIAASLEEYSLNNFHEYKILKISSDYKDHERYNILQTANKCIDEDKPVILFVSIGCGAEGINLQKFSKMISFDPEYNGKTEDQANSRLHRIGQTEKVEIWQLSLDDFVAYGNVTISIDSKIQAIRDEKIHVSDLIDEYNAAFSFRRYYYVNSEGERECGTYFGKDFEIDWKDKMWGPDTIGPNWII
jgi:SNF2 family DNA or RNA helicase